MATTGSFTIGGTSPDYATIQAWADAPTGNLTGIFEGKMRAGDYTETADIDMAGNGYTTSASNYMLLTYDTGAYHAGDTRGGVSISGGTAHLLNVTTDFTRIVGLNFNRWWGTSTEAIRMSATGCFVEHCLFWGAENVNADGIFFDRTTGTDELYVSNCFFGWLGRSAILAQGSTKAGKVWIYNCTAVFCVGALQGHATLSGWTTRLSYPVFGDDLNNPTTVGITWTIKNTFSHGQDTANSVSAPSFHKIAASSWGTGSGYNASTDDTASDIHATNYQDNVDVDTQFENIPAKNQISANTGASYTVDWEDSEIQANNPTVNYGTDTVEGVDNSPLRNYILRADLSGLPSTARVLGARLLLRFQSENISNPISYTFYRPLRAWTETGVTYNKYDGTTDWTTAGALGSGDVETLNIDGGSATSRSFSFIGAPTVEAGDWYIAAGGKFVEWVQDAIDGIAPGAVDTDFELITRYFSEAGDVNWYSRNHTDGLRPFVMLYWDTAAAPLDVVPDTGGVLDGNGTDLASDSEYPIGSTDLYGFTRDASWDIGAGALVVLQTGTAGLPTAALAALGATGSSAISTDAGLASAAFAALGATGTAGAVSTTAGVASAALAALGDVGSTTTPTASRDHFRLRNDDGSETAATWIAAEDNGSASLVPGDDFRLRETIDADLGRLEGQIFQSVFRLGRVNLLTYSEQFDHADWSDDGTGNIAANDLVAPWGGTIADKLEKDSARSTSAARIYQADAGQLSDGESYTFTVYAHEDEASWIALSCRKRNDLTYYAWFDLNTGSTGTVQGGMTHTIEAVGGGWHRCRVTVDVGTGANAQGVWAVHLAANDADADITALADNDGVHVFAAMLSRTGFVTPYQKIEATEDLTWQQLTF